LFVEIMRLLLVITSIRARKIIRKFASNNSTIYTTFDFSAFIHHALLNYQ